MSLRPPSQYRNRLDPRETWAFYVDGQPVRLKGPVATVQQILESAGVSPKAVLVQRIWSPQDPSGKPIGLEDSVSAFPEGHVYLRTLPVSSDPNLVAEAPVTTAPVQEAVIEAPAVEATSVPAGAVTADPA